MPNFLYKTLPRQHQEDAFLFLYSLFMSGKNYGALFMEQGTGKTKVAIDVASNLFKEKKIDAVMLIAPNGIQDQWGDEQIPLHSPIPFTTFTWENGGSQRYIREMFSFIKTRQDNIKWFLINVEAFSSDSPMMIFKEFLQMNRTMVIVDEATRIKSPDAKRTQNIIQGLSKLTKLGKRVTGIEPLSAYRMILTGTPVTTGPYNVWSMFEFLEHDYFKRDFISFKSHFGIQIQEENKTSRKIYYRQISEAEINQVRQYRQKGKSVEDISRILRISESSVQYLLNNPSVRSPYKNLDELKAQIASVAFTVRKKDCLDLPDKVFEHRYVRMTAEQTRTYKELIEQMMSEYKGVELEVVNKLVLIGRLQQITGGFFPGKTDFEDGILVPFDTNPKLNALVEDIDELADESMIVVARFTAELKQIYSRLKKEYPEKTIGLVYGGVSTGERNFLLNQFKNGELNILVANARTIGVGQNLQRSHATLFYSNSFSFEEREQMEDRTHRDGQDIAPLYKDYIVKGTVDERVLNVLKEKRNLSDYMRSKNIGEFIQ